MGPHTRPPHVYCRATPARPRYGIARSPSVTDALDKPDWESLSIGAHGRSPVRGERSASAGPTSANPAELRSPGCTSHSGTAIPARCGHAAPRPRTASTAGRTLTLLPREQQQVLEQRRIEQQTKEWKARYDMRAGIEGTVSQAVRTTGIRRTRYTGLAKTHLGNVLAATAINLVRLDAWLTGTPLGTTRTSHLAALHLAA
ncbi:transposase [Kitasatospora sp. NBC_00240]|uniref:transposase n=1 Tax=Kitasatospora sp. NBC_00240 TaxID=2903567 RepID=UPI00225903A7|nr:transposase [Kitasatospora sp. NBC_00240]MCX5215474.1 transposase [Kitasatospora sp. NBC_00240]